MKRYTYTWIVASLFSAIALVSVLTLMTELKSNYQHTSFSRYVHDNPLTQTSVLDLKYNSYYFAGHTAHYIYLGNTNAPRLLVTVSNALTDSTHTLIKVPRLRYSALQLKVDSPRFTLADGTVPYIYAGKLSDLTTQQVLDSIYFISTVPISPTSFALVALSGRENTLEKYTTGDKYPQLFKGLLEKQTEGIFSTDGMLHYDSHTARLLYLYFYRNEYLYLDTAFSLLHKGHTVDTISQAKITVGKTDDNTFTMASPPLMVNKRSYLHGRYLFNNSNILARNDSREKFEAGSIIDIYDVTTGEYKFSFYIPTYDSLPANSFTITGSGLLAVLYANYLVTYQLNFTQALNDFIAQ